jgi:predicted DNA-binding transcriptional regulator YafY
VKPDGSPTSRALRTLELLQATPGIRAEVLAERLGVTERATRRYIGILREAGIPVVSERGPYGGYRLGRGLRLPPLVFSATEALGLVMAVLDGHHAAANPDDPVGSALGTLMRALPEGVAAQAAAVRKYAEAAPDRAAVRPDPATTSALVQAVASEHQVRVEYHSEAGSQWTTTVDPWAVVVRFGRWYLLCFSHSADDVRTYRIDRVRSVVELDESFEPPSDLDPVTVLEENLGSGWEYATDVLIEDSLDNVRWVAGGLGRLEAESETTTRLRGSTGNPYWYAERLARIPVGFHVEGGPELRQCVAKFGARMVAAAGD